MEMYSRQKVSHLFIKSTLLWHLLLSAGTGVIQPCNVGLMANIIKITDFGSMCLLVAMWLLHINPQQGAHL